MNLEMDWMETGVRVSHNNWIEGDAWGTKEPTKEPPKESPNEETMRSIGRLRKQRNSITTMSKMDVLEHRQRETKGDKGTIVQRDRDR